MYTTHKRAAKKREKKRGDIYSAPFSYYIIPAGQRYNKTWDFMTW